ncbi:hypothetical protein B0H21DRAFT_36783 [Amylocystis lapponica]|nr:hypothetical protein B0H21DRAFT_36783 [Amylocystis lapponica]
MQCHERSLQVGTNNPQHSPPHSYLCILSLTMKSLFYLASLVALAASCNGLVVPSGHIQQRSACTSYTVVSTSYVVVGNDTVDITTLACDNAVTTREEPPNALREFADGDVCGDICTNVCNFAGGVLPPEADDCAVIVDAITILDGDIEDDFIVGAGEVKQLTYQTCRYFLRTSATRP